MALLVDKEGKLVTTSHHRLVEVEGFYYYPPVVMLVLIKEKLEQIPDLGIIIFSIHK